MFPSLKRVCMFVYLRRHIFPGFCLPYFLALTSTKTATAPIIPPKTSNTCNGNDPVAVTVPLGAGVDTKASSLLPEFCILANPAICNCALGGGLQEWTCTAVLS